MALHRQQPAALLGRRCSKINSVSHLNFVLHLGGGLLGGTGGERQPYKMLGCSFRRVSNIAREERRELENISAVWL